MTPLLLLRPIIVISVITFMAIMDPYYICLLRRTVRTGSNLLEKYDNRSAKSLKLLLLLRYSMKGIVSCLRLLVWRAVISLSFINKYRDCARNKVNQQSGRQLKEKSIDLLYILIFYLLLSLSYSYQNQQILLLLPLRAHLRSS